MNRGTWATDFLRALGNTNPDARTVNFVASWTLGENTRAKYNPLATTQPMAGGTNFNSVGVKNYITHEEGIQASVKTLTNGRYPSILEGLRNNDPERAVNALELGTWGTGLGFTTLWRLGDHRNEMLLSHPAGDTPETPPQPPWGPGGGGGGSWDDPVPPDPYATMNDGKRLRFILVGVLFVGIAIVITLKTYVPGGDIAALAAKVAV